MILDPKVPVTWNLGGDIDVARRIAPLARKTVMECFQALNREYPWVGQTIRLPEGTIEVRAGFGSVRVDVYAWPKPVPDNPLKFPDPNGKGVVNWQARGFVLCPALADNTPIGYDPNSVAPVQNGLFGWVLISKYAPNYPDDIFRKKLGLDLPTYGAAPPPTETKFRTLVRHHRLFSQRDLEEFDRRPNGTKPGVNDIDPPPVKNEYRPGIKRYGTFYPQYKSTTELEDEYKPAPLSNWAAHWPTPIAGSKFAQGLLYKSNAYRADAGQLPVTMPLKGWSDDLAYLAVKGCISTNALGHNLPPEPSTTPAFLGARPGFQWAFERMNAAGAYAGENVLNHTNGLSATYQGGINAADSWRQSPPHYSNIISPSWSGTEDGNQTYRVFPDLHTGDDSAYPAFHAIMAGKYETARKVRGTMGGAFSDGAAYLFRESGPPYQGSINKLPESQVGGRQWGAQVFALPAPTVAPQALNRPISYPYKINRIWSPQLGAGPFSAYVDRAIGAAFVTIHCKNYVVATPESGLVADGLHVVLAAGYRTDDAGKTFIRSVVFTADHPQLVVNPSPIPNELSATAWRSGWELDGQPRPDGGIYKVLATSGYFKYDTNRVCKIIVTETPFDLAYYDDLVDTPRPAKYEPRIRLVTTHNLPPAAHTILGAAVSADGTKQAILYSYTGLKSNLGAPPQPVSEDFLRTVVEGDVYSDSFFNRYGEITLAFEATGDGAFAKVREAAAVVSITNTHATIPGGTDWSAATSCVASVPVGVAYSGTGVLQYAEQVLQATQNAENNAGGCTIKADIRFPDGQLLPAVDEHLTLVPGGFQSGRAEYSGYTRQRMLLFCDWYKPDDTVYMQTYADIGGLVASIECGVTATKVLKTLETLPFDSYAGRNTFMVFGSHNILGRILSPAGFSYYGFGLGGATASNGFSYYYPPPAAQGRHYSGEGLARTSTISRFAPGPVPGGDLASGTRVFNDWGALKPSVMAHPAQLGVTFYAAMGGSATFWERPAALGGNTPADAPLRRNAIAVTALDGEVIVEGVWLHIGTGYKAAEHSATVNYPPTDPQAPGYFRCSTLDIESILGGSVKYTLPFGVIE